MSKKQRVIEYLKAWQKLDKQALEILDDSLIHESNFAVYTSKSDFIAACWGKHNDFDAFDFLNVVEDENTVVIEYQIIDDNSASKPICEWYHFKDDKIVRIKVYF